MEGDDKAERKVSSMKLELLLTADYASVSLGGKLNVMGIFREIRAKVVPARHPQMYVVVGLVASPAEFGSEHEMKIEILDADAQNTVVEWSQRFEVPDPRGKSTSAIVNSILDVRDAVFPDYGAYAVYVTVDTLTFDQAYPIRVVPPPEPTSSDGG